MLGLLLLMLRMYSDILFPLYYALSFFPLFLTFVILVKFSLYVFFPSNYLNILQPIMVIIIKFLKIEPIRAYKYQEKIISILLSLFSSPNMLRLLTVIILLQGPIPPTFVQINWNFNSRLLLIFKFLLSYAVNPVLICTLDFMKI